MENSYIVRLKDNQLFCFYYVKGRGLLYKTYEHNKWVREKILLEQGRENFTVTIDDKGIIYLLCQDSMGDVVLLTNGEGDWVSKVILKNQSTKVHSILLKPIITEKGICLIYNVPAVEEKANYIVFQNLDGDGRWSPAQRIDRFTGMNNQMFQVQHVTREHVLLFYYNKAMENNIGYREITPTKVGSYNNIYTSVNQIQDACFLTTDNAIHVCYIVKSVFSSQLIYRKKEDEGFSHPIVIAESQKLDNCIMFYVKNTLYIMYVSNGQLFETRTEDRGKTFYRPARYRNKFCLNPMKANYISLVPQSEDNFYCRELYVDRSHPWDIQVLPDKNDDFYPALTPLIRPADAEALQSQPTAVKKKPEIQPQISDDLSEKLFSLTNQVTSLQRQITEKNDQLLEITSMLKERNEEVRQIETERKNYYLKSLDERNELLDRIKYLEEKNEEYLLQLSKLKERSEELYKKTVSAEINPEETPVDNSSENTENTTESPAEIEKPQQTNDNPPENEVTENNG